MTVADGSAPACRWTGRTEATRNLSLDRKAGTVTDILARKLVQRAQRHAARHHASEHQQTAQRLTTAELLLDGVSAQVTCHSILLGTTQAVNDPGVITAAIRISDEVALAELALRLWTPAELDAFAAQKAESDPS